MTTEELKRRGWELYQVGQHGETCWRNWPVEAIGHTSHVEDIEELIDSRLREFIWWQYSEISSIDRTRGSDKMILDFYASREKKDDA
jgi:hypothetical protein